MPEGDTIFRAAQTLQRALAGKPVVFFESMLPALDRVEITGRTIDRVSTAGKHLLMHFSGDLVLRTHMRMNGSWHIYRRGERWQRPRRDMRVVIATDDFEAVGFSIPEAELIATRDLRRHDDLRKLGPDLLAEAFDAGEALRRLRERGVLRQRGSLHDSRQTYFWLAEAVPALAPGGASDLSLADARAAAPGGHRPSEPAISAP